jgi:threonine dehydrogenase-like Zn-dependent dehydrogenase
MRALVLDAEWSPRSDADPDPDDSDRTRRRATDASSAFRRPELRVERREPPDPGPAEALVRVRYAGVCGSDVSLTETDEEGYVHYSAYAALPNVLGHEFAGEVVETGADVRGFAPGDLVTAEVTDYCGRCRTCKLGHRGHCEHFEQLGFTVPGAFAEYVAVPERLLWDVGPLRDAHEDDDAVLRAAATVEPSTITYQGLFRRAEGVVPGDYHVYHGVGPIGLTGMNLSRAAGAGAVVGFEPTAERRAVARDLGFEHVYDPTAVDPVETVARVTGGDGADVHVETAGAVGQTYPVIEDSLAEGASVVHISNAARAAAVDLRKYQGAAAGLYGSEGHTGQGIYPRVIRLMAAGRLDNRELITSVYPLARADEAVERAAQRVDGKVLVDVGAED